MQYILEDGTVLTDHFKLPFKWVSIQKNDGYNPDGSAGEFVTGVHCTQEAAQQFIDQFKEFKNLYSTLRIAKLK